MATYLIPTSDDILEAVARSIARDRLLRDSEFALKNVIPMATKTGEDLDAVIDKIFDLLWNGTSEFDSDQRKLYKQDALAAIRTINLKLLTLTT